MKNIIYIFILSFCVYFACNKKTGTHPAPIEKCTGIQAYKPDSFYYDNLPYIKDSIQIIEINGENVTLKDTIKLNSFCDVKFKVRINSKNAINRVMVSSENKGFWTLDSTLVNKNMIIFSFTAADLNGFAYTLNKINFGFNFISNTSYLTDSKFIIRNI